jgi:hypothetical protein
MLSHSPVGAAGRAGGRPGRPSDHDAVRAARSQATRRRHPGSGQSGGRGLTGRKAGRLEEEAQPRPAAGLIAAVTVTPDCTCGAPRKCSVTGMD